MDENFSVFMIVVRYLLNQVGNKSGFDLNAIQYNIYSEVVKHIRSIPLLLLTSNLSWNTNLCSCVLVRRHVGSSQFGDNTVSNFVERTPARPRPPARRACARKAPSCSAGKGGWLGAAAAAAASQTAPAKHLNTNPNP